MPHIAHDTVVIYSTVHSNAHLGVHDLFLCQNGMWISTHIKSVSFVLAEDNCLASVFLSPSLALSQKESPSSTSIFSWFHYNGLIAMQQPVREKFIFHFIIRKLKYESLAWH